MRAKNTDRHHFMSNLTVVAFFAVCLFFPFSAYADDAPMCSSVPEIIADWMPCWFCPIFDVFFQSAGTFSYHAYEEVSEDAYHLLTVGILLWLGRKSMEALGSVAGFNPGEFWKGVNQRLFATVVAGALLQASPGEVFGYIFSPLIEGAAGFGSALLGGGTCDGDGASFDIISGSVFSQGTMNALHCIIEQLNSSVGRGIGVGVSTMCAALPSGITDPFFDIKQLVYGSIIILVYAWLILVMPFYVMDGCIRLGVVGALMPIFIIAWVFPSTKWFAKKGWAMLVNSMMIIIAMCLLLGLVAAMIDDILTNDPTIVDMLQIEDFGDFADVVVDEILVGPKLIVCGFIGIFMVGKAPEIGDHFSEVNTSGMNSMAKVAGALSKAVKQIAMAAVIAAAAVATGGAAAAAAPAAAGGGAAGGAAAGGAAGGAGAGAGAGAGGAGAGAGGAGAGGAGGASGGAGGAQGANAGGQGGAKAGSQGANNASNAGNKSGKAQMDNAKKAKNTANRIKNATSGGNDDEDPGNEGMPQGGGEGDDSSEDNSGGGEEE